jgi:hypothetical protein
MSSPTAVIDGLRAQTAHIKLHEGFDPQQTAVKDMANTTGLQTQARRHGFQRDSLNKQGTGQLDLAGEYRISTPTRGFIVGVQAYERAVSI